jgi:hypothetical protein
MKISQEAQLMPEPPAVDHNPIGGKVGINDETKTYIESIISNSESPETIVVKDTIGATYGKGNTTEAYLMEHIRKRNLGY